MGSATVAASSQRIPRYTSYPTAPHFGPAIDDAVFTCWLSELPADSRVSVYLHVPFCAAMCWYCGCHTTVVRQHRPIGEYALLMEREIALLATHVPALELTAVHWGGGTPNMLLGGELKRLTTALGEYFRFTGDTEIAAELDPRLLTRDKIAEFTAVGLNRASLGVQDFDSRVQEAINRIQPYAMTREAVASLRNSGIRSINLDLMYGLPYQTVESLLSTIDRAVDLNPERVALYGYAHVPWMKRHQRLMPTEALPSPSERLAQCNAAAERLVRHGYCRIGLDHFAHPEDLMAIGQADGTLRRNFQGYTTDASEVVLGFGASAISTLPSGYAQNAPDVATYRGRIESGRAATVRGIETSREDKLRRAVIETLMCTLRVDVAEVTFRHGMNPEIFTGSLPALTALERDGLIERAGWRVCVTEAGRPFVRAVCAAFDAYWRGADIPYSGAI